MPDESSRDDSDAMIYRGGYGWLEEMGTSPKFPVANRLRAQIDDCKKQIGKLNTKRGMLIRQIETLEDAVRELKAKGTQ